MIIPPDGLREGTFRFRDKAEPVFLEMHQVAGAADLDVAEDLVRKAAGAAYLNLGHASPLC